MTTIGFFGDSFCASNQPESWCNILQQKLGYARPRWFGNPGTSIWSVFMQFNKLIEQGSRSFYILLDRTLQIISSKLNIKCQHNSFGRSRSKNL
jgi:hypothetical protein